MASGTIYGATHGGLMRLELDWSSTPDPINNRSNVSAALYLRVLSGNFNIDGTRQPTTTIDGTTTSATRAGFSAGPGRYHLMSASKANIAHNSDGTKSINLAAYFNIQITINGTWTPSMNIPSTAVALDLIEQAVVHLYDSSGARRRSKSVWVYDAGGVPRKAKGVWVYDSTGTPRKSK